MLIYIARNQTELTDRTKPLFFPCLDVPAPIHIIMAPNMK